MTRESLNKLGLADCIRNEVTSAFITLVNKNVEMRKRLLAQFDNMLIEILDSDDETDDNDN